MKKYPPEEMTSVDYNSMGQDILPPAYKQPMTNSQKLTRILSYTLVSVTLIVGIFVLTGIYIRSQRQQCNCGFQEDKFSRRIDRLDSIESINDPLNAMPSEIVPKKTALPLNLQLDDVTGKMLDKNQKAHVNCVIEKRKASQVISQEPKTLMTPFGNITSDPGMIHLTGEKMTFSCFTGVKKNKPKRLIKNSTIFLGDKSRPRRASGSECACNCVC